MRCLRTALLLAPILVGACAGNLDLPATPKRLISKREVINGRSSIEQQPVPEPGSRTSQCPLLA